MAQTCKCGKQHKKLSAVARCLWRRAAWIEGDGPFAVLAHCRALTVMRHPDEGAARASQRQIDKTGCGGLCSRRHEIVEIRLPD
jgi:hypothetical protein